MGIPPLDDLGLLPAGVWDCALEDVQAIFCSTPHRHDLWSGLLEFLEAEVRPHGALPIWIDGSFTRRKDLPQDIDVVVDFPADHPGRLTEALSLYVRRRAIKTAYHVDAYPRHPDLPKDLADYFQYAGPKCAAELRIDERYRKGILRVLP